MPFASWGFPSCGLGMKHTTAYFPGSSLTVAVVVLPGLAMLGPPTNTVVFCTAPMLVLIAAFLNASSDIEPNLTS